MGRRNKARIQAIRYGMETPIKLQRQLDTIESLSDEYGSLVTEEIAKAQKDGRLKPFWGVNSLQ